MISMELAQTVGAVVSSLATAAAAVLMACTLKATRRAVKAALDANEIIRAEQRAWLQVKITLAGDLSWQGNAKLSMLDVGDRIASAPLEIELINCGRMPAFDVRIAQQSFLRHPTESTAQSFEDLIQATVTPSDRQRTGYVLFPGQSRKTTVNAGFGERVTLDRIAHLAEDEPRFSMLATSVVVAYRLSLDDPIIRYTALARAVTVRPSHRKDGGITMSALPIRKDNLQIYEGPVNAERVT